MASDIASMNVVLDMKDCLFDSYMLHTGKRDYRHEKSSPIREVSYSDTKLTKLSRDDSLTLCANVSYVEISLYVRASRLDHTKIFICVNSGKRDSPQVQRHA